MKLRFELLDRIDVEQLRDTLATPGWKIFVQRVRETLEQAASQAMNAPTWEEHRELRGAVKALRTVLDIPAIITSEVKRREEAKPELAAKAGSEGRPARTRRRG